MMLQRDSSEFSLSLNALLLSRSATTANQSLFVADKNGGTDNSSLYLSDQSDISAWEVLNLAIDQIKIRAENSKRITRPSTTIAFAQTLDGSM